METDRCLASTGYRLVVLLHSKLAWQLWLLLAPDVFLLWLWLQVACLQADHHAQWDLLSVPAGVAATVTYLLLHCNIFTCTPPLAPTQVRDIVEPAFKPGDSTLQLLGTLTPLIRCVV